MSAIDYSQLTMFIHDSMAAAATAPSTNARITRQYGQIMQNLVRLHTTGLPGPTIRTGRYRSSIALDFNSNGDTSSSEVYTPEPRGYRLEYGFVGVDSAGRLVSSRAFPHFVPSINTAAPIWEEALTQALVRAIAKGK